MGQGPASTTWQLWATHLPASSQGMPDLKSCSRRPWPGLNAWHDPSMFSEAANASCLAVTWSTPAQRPALTFRGPDKAGPYWVGGTGSRKPSLFPRSHLWAPGLKPHCHYNVFPLL